MSGRGRSGNPSGGRGRGGRGGASGGGGGRGGAPSGGGSGRRGGGGGRGGGPPPSSSSGGGGGGNNNTRPGSASSNNSSNTSNTNRRGGGGGGRGGSGGGGNRRNRGRGASSSGPDKRAAAEQKRLDAERKRKEEEAARLAAEQAELERQRLAELERRRKLQSEYESSVQAAVSTLESYTSSCQLHSELRSQLSPQPMATASGEEKASPLESSRMQFELSKKKLKSDLKKCTAFVKKIKAGTYPSPKELESPNNPIKTLNLSRYVEEVAGALVEPQGKVKQSDVPGMVILCVEMHRRYPTFASALVPTLLATVNGNGNDADGGLPRRICFRLLTEFVLHGVITDIKPIMKIIHDASGAPSEEGKEYVVTDANLIVTFAKTGGNEILGVVPRSLVGEMDRLQKEIEGKGEGALVFVSETATTVATEEATYVAKEGVDAKQNDEKPASATATDKATIDLETPFTPTLSAELHQKCQSTIDLFRSTIPTSRAVSPPITMTLHTHCLGAYRTLSHSYVTTHRRLLKLEKRCEQDRLLQGNLSEAREKGLKDAQSLMESLKKSVETLSEALAADVPILEEEETPAEGAADGKGIELWTKSGNDADGDDAERLGPFDDEETRSFYCDVPDLLSTKPPALLGINPMDLEKQKERNLRQYGGNGDGDGVVGDGDEMSVEDIVGSEELPGEDAEAPEETEVEGEEKDVETEEGEYGEKGEKPTDDAENKDTPHYKLMVLLEQELPEASRRDTIDELADRFCVNHGSNKKSRKRLYETLFLVPRSRLDLLPYYSRFAAIMDHVYSDSTLVKELEGQMHGQARFKKNQNIESRLRTTRYLGELTKFRVAPPIVVLRGLRRCLEDFTGYNIDVACCLLESCGRYLYRMKHTHGKLAELMDTMMRIKKARNLDERHVAMITSAFLMVNPPPQTSRPTKEVPPLEAYLRHLLLTRLEAEEKSISFVSKQIQRMPWSDPGVDCGVLVCKYMLKACRRGRYKATKAIASLATNLKRSKPEVPARLIDHVLEEIQWFMEHPNFRDHQRTLVCARLLGELYCAAAIPSTILFDEVHHILNFNHDIPEALRQASENQELFAPRGNISQVIHEDEELEEEEEEEEEKEEEKPQVVSISSLSKYDPRVPSGIDPPTAVFRIKLVCTILETVSSHIVTVNNKAKLEFALASLQRYLFTKKSLPSDVEFSVLDLFDSLDSELKKNSSGGGKSKKAAAASFVRYNSWLDAHQFVVAAEKSKALDEARVRVRVLAQAGLLGAVDASITDGDLLDEDVDNVVMSDEEDSVEGDSDDDSGEESVASGVAADEANDNVSESGSSDDGEESSDDDEEGDGIDEAVAEAAYMRQLQDEEFESELRRLTMEALEKGKVSARTSAGGNAVSSQMPAAPEFVSKKPASDQSHSVAEGDSAVSPFGGEEGMAFKLFKRGNKGKQEEVQLFVPKSTNLARRATKQDDEAAKERDLLKARVLQYEAESADAGGNVYLDETKLQVIRNRPLTMETINKNFGKSTDAPYKVSERFRGRGPGPGPGRGPGRGRGRGRGGGRLFNPGSGRG